MRNRNGFSLVELAVVILIAGLALAFSLPALNRYLTGHNLRNGTSILLSETTLARHKAVTKGARVWVWFGVGGNTYWIGEQLPAGNGTFTALVWNGPFSLPSRVRIAQASYGGLNYFWYAPDGRPTNGGSTMLVATAGAADTSVVYVDLTGSVWK